MTFIVASRRRLGLLLLGAGVLAALLAAPPAADAGDMPSKRYRDRNAKFSFRFFNDWSPVPVEAQGKGLHFGGDTDKFLVARFMQNGADKRGLIPSQIEVYRMGNGTAGQASGGETTPGDDGKKDEDPFMKKLRELASEDDPKTMKELIQKAMSHYAWGDVILDPKAAKDVKSKDGITGKMWVLEKKWSDHEPSALLIAGMWKKDDMEIGLWCLAPGESKKKFEQGFQAVIKSFMFFDPQAEEVECQECLNGLPISAKKRRQIERSMVQGWAIRVSAQKNYIVIYNTKGRRNDLLAKIIADRIEAIRAQVYEVKFPAAQKVEAVSICRICGDESEYHFYGGPWGSAGYWNSDAEELVFYDASPKKEPDDDTLAVLYHEAFHQYIYYSVGEVAPHSWFNEGTGDYFAGARYAGGKFSIRPFNWRVETIRNAIRAGPCAWEETTRNGHPDFHFDRSSHGYTPIRPFVRMTQGNYYDENIGVNYAQGWSFIYFLREIVPKDPKMNAKWGKILETYFDTLKAEVNKEKPLVPKSNKPSQPGGMDDDPDSGMDDDPGMTDPGMTDPGMDDPGMGSTGGMDDPSGGGDAPPEIPRIFSKFMSSDSALKAAVDAAFKDWTDADYAELETAWKAAILKVH